MQSSLPLRDLCCHPQLCLDNELCMARHAHECNQEAADLRMYASRAAAARSTLGTYICYMYVCAVSA